MDLTEIIRNITGLGGAPGAGPAAPQPPAGVHTAAAGAPAPATAMPPAPPQAPGAPTGSPPDLTALYQKMMDQSRSDKYIDKGASLIAAGFAQPQNRAAIIGAMGGGGGSGGNDPASALNTILGLQKQQQAVKTRAEQMARLPAIAKQYGLDMNTVQYLFETGKLDETINSMAQPDMVVESRPDGSKYLLNKKSGVQGRELSGPDKYYGFTADLKELDRVNAERAARGEPAIPAETWLTESQRNKATKFDLGTKLEVRAGENRLKALDESANAVAAGVSTIEKVHSALDTLDKGVISGSILAPAAVEARKLVGSIFGFTDEIANNSDTFQAQMKEVVLPRVKALGTGNSISNADREFVEKAVAGTIVLDAKSIREVLRILEKGERNAAAKYNKEVDDFGKIDENSAKAMKYARRFQFPAPRVKPETVEAFKNDYKNSDDAGKKAAVKSFDEAFGAGASSYFMD